jgi:hypothetical protein
LQIGPLISKNCRLVPQGKKSRNQSKVKSRYVASPKWLRGHMAAYIRGQVINAQHRIPFNH